MNIGIIGGSDGPTMIFLSPSPVRWFFVSGLVFVLLILLPNILAAFRLPKREEPVSRAVRILEQIGRYACMLLMVTDFGILGTWFSGLEGLALYYVGNALLILAYWICWGFFFRAQSRKLALALAVLPGCVFALSGLCMHHWMLIAAALLFTAVHIYITFHAYQE